jgi:hypothetical protein
MLDISSLKTNIWYAVAIPQIISPTLNDFDNYHLSAAMTNSTEVVETQWILILKSAIQNEIIKEKNDLDQFFYLLQSGIFFI